MENIFLSDTAAKSDEVRTTMKYANNIAHRTKKKRYSTGHLSGMHILRSEKGIALVMVLVLALIALAVVSTMIYLVIQGTKYSGYSKRYATALDAGHGASEITTALINNRGNLVIDGLGIALSPQCVCGFDANPLDELYPDPSPNTCLCRKLCMPPYSGAIYNWGQGPEPCHADGANMNPLDHPDMQFDLTGFGTNYRVTTKIVDTTIGATDLSGEQLSCGTGVGYQCGALEGIPTPYLYRVEINSQDANPLNVRERSRLSVLYAY